MVYVKSYYNLYSLSSVIRILNCIRTAYARSLQNKVNDESRIICSRQDTSSFVPTEQSIIYSQ